MENIDGIISHRAHMQLEFRQYNETLEMLLRKPNFTSLKILNWHFLLSIMKQIVKKTNRKIKRSFTDYFLSFSLVFLGQNNYSLNLSHTHTLEKLQLWLPSSRLSRLSLAILQSAATSTCSQGKLLIKLEIRPGRKSEHKTLRC